LVTARAAPTSTPGAAASASLTAARWASAEAATSAAARAPPSAEAAARRPRGPRTRSPSAGRPTGGPPTPTHRSWSSGRRRSAARRRLVDADHTAIEVGAIHASDRSIRLVLGAHLDEAEVARTLCLTVGHDHRRLHHAVARERAPQAVIQRREGEPPHEE